ncbi:putative membrane protein YeiH [Aurantimicrobium minutum]|uniref:trimeric intracellular cation channel family protein n=1 Tax=Aurantimicrobium minutum TaxID=708131 RepID=UPI002473CF2E|nr:TRIC cation channel family protein [Aurantimicrobium minutum]MDH6533090.1 putative membrane protein YeiH [Aurantimicrobium minutum]
MLIAEPLDLPEWVNGLAIGVASVQGATYASGFRDRKLDLFGVAVIGIATGLGGGFLRDLLLNRLPVALTENWYILVAIVAALLGMLLARMFRRVDWMITVLDALALGLFAALGTTAALVSGLPFVPSLFVGVITAVGGGFIRDVLLNMPISVMHVGSLYAVAAAAGSLALLLCNEANIGLEISVPLCISVTVVLRLLAVRFGWSLPEQRMLKSLRNPKLIRPADLTGPIDTQRDL